MLHENTATHEEETRSVLESRRRWSMALLTFFTVVYAGFIFLCAFAYQQFAQLTWMGVPAPVWYGLGIIMLALAIAGIYGRVTRIRSVS